MGSGGVHRLDHEYRLFRHLDPQPTIRIFLRIYEHAWNELQPMEVWGDPEDHPPIVLGGCLRGAVTPCPQNALVRATDLALLLEAHLHLLAEVGLHRFDCLGKRHASVLAAARQPKVIKW
jgi:hypothetical protein